MTYVIGEPCIDVVDRACVEECPVDCIYEGARALYIHPDECVDCGACEPVCPVEAIYYEDDLPEPLHPYLQDNEDFFTQALPGQSEPLQSPGGAAKLGRIGADTRSSRRTRHARSDRALGERPCTAADSWRLAQGTARSGGIAPATGGRCGSHRGHAQGWLDERHQSHGSDWCAHLRQHTLHQTQVHRAHDLAVLLGDLQERAVAKQDLAARLGLSQLRDESDLVEDPQQLGGRRCFIGAPIGTRPLRQIMPPGPPSLPGRLGRVRHRAGNKTGQDASQQPVAPLVPMASWRTHRRKTQPRSARLGAILDVAGHHTLGDQTVQMEPHGIDVQPHLGGQLLHAHSLLPLPQGLQDS